MPFDMPHATSLEDLQEEADELLIQQALDPENPIDFNRELEPGEKADDAIDFGDLDNDDLAEDEGEVHSLQPDSGPDLGHFLVDKDSSRDLDKYPRNAHRVNPSNGGTGEDDGFDDLFGDMPSSPVRGEYSRDKSQLSSPSGSTSPRSEDGRSNHYSSAIAQELRSHQIQGFYEGANRDPPLHISSSSKDAASWREQQLQQELFALSGSSLAGQDNLPPPPENQEELLLSLWPRFEKNTVPKFMNLLPPKRIRYTGKRPFKKPKILQPTKASLEIAQDQEKMFRLSLIPNHKVQDKLERSGVIGISSLPLTAEVNDGGKEVGLETEQDSVGGITWQDLQFVCQDWDGILSNDPWISQGQDIITSDDVSRGFIAQSFDKSDLIASKKRKLAHDHDYSLYSPDLRIEPLHDPEEMALKLAKGVILDLNDPGLLVDSTLPEDDQPMHKSGRGLISEERRAFTKGLNQRYNISNDDAYDLLKENHQSKIRSTLGTLTVEHSLPAMRLQWPYYKTKLEKQEARSFHRPSLKFQRNERVVFHKPGIVKRKHLKGKDVQAVFEKAKDLSLKDNSNVLLLEYSEEYPTMMSNFGMGSRLINYYRRKNLEDISRPKLDVGETAVLLPQDKSPFSIFGNVDPGQVTPALYNSMFRAPVFRQSAKPTDFLVIRNTTGENGPTWYIRNIDNLYVVGQQFPSVDVPGPHSRKVTTAAKNRLKMISYRQIRKRPIHRISVGDVTKHFLDTTDLQNRQKMKEFMQFSKEHKEWEMRPGEAVPTEEAIRALIKPEDVCLLESMQVGQQHLQDAGFSKGDDDSEDDDGKEGQSVEQQLAPWYTTRNFLNATQGKAMLQLHGEGDPSGRGEAFSFMKTSMKGGFKAVGESVEDKLDAKKLKELGGHSYNVARQQRSYEESIRRIWEAQRQSLSSTLEQSDTDVDDDNPEETDGYFGSVRTPQSEAQNTMMFRRHDDETTSQFSKFSTDSHTGKVLRITREIWNTHGELEQVQDVIRDPRVIRQYLKRRYAKEAEDTMLSELKPTGDAEQDRRNQQRLEKELARLERNKDRRIARDKQKGLYVDVAAEPSRSSTSPAAVPVKGSATSRKCANCGQVGHIKTNKK